MPSLALPSVPASVSLALDAAESAARGAGLSEEVQARVGLAVAEAVANAIEHGNEGVASRRVHVAVTPEARVLLVEVSDEGDGVRASHIEDAELPLDPLQTGGRGLYLIRELADGVEVDGASIRLRFTERSDGS